MRLKRWESPRRQGRNDKGKGGAARKRQLKKRQQMLRKKLKENNKEDNHRNNKWGKDLFSFPHFFSHFYVTKNTADLILMRYRTYCEKKAGIRSRE